MVKFSSCKALRDFCFIDNVISAGFRRFSALSQVVRTFRETAPHHKRVVWREVCGWGLGRRACTKSPHERGSVPSLRGAGNSHPSVRGGVRCPLLLGFGSFLYLRAKFALSQIAGASYTLDHGSPRFSYTLDDGGPRFSYFFPRAEFCQALERERFRYPLQVTE